MRKAPPRNVRKAFLIASFMGSVLKAHTTGAPRLTALHIRINQAMKRYNILAGRKEYFELTNKGLDIWTALSKKHSTKLSHDETELFIEYMGHLLSPRDYKDFLGFTHFTSNVRASKETFAEICTSLIDLGEQVDMYVGTKACSSQLKTVKTKQKVVRDASKKLSKHDKQVQADKSRKERKKVFMASLRARADALRSGTNDN